MSGRIRIASSLLGFIAVWLIFILSDTGRSSNDLSVPRPVTAISYTANVGQFDESVLYQVELGDAAIYFHPDGITHVFLEQSDQLTESYDIPDLEDIDLLDPNYAPRPKIKVTTARTRFVGANPEASVIGQERQRHFKNYFIGDDQSKWRQSVPTYNAILYQEIYPAVDLKYYSRPQTGIKYDFIVHPGGDYSRIKLQYEGMDVMEVTPDGRLRFENRAGFIEEGFPKIYQDINGQRIEIPGRYEVTGDKQFGFALDSPANPDFPIVIDPTFMLTTYQGGTLPDWGYDVVVAKGIIPWVYIIGHTWSTDFPVDGFYGPYQGTLNGDFDVFLSIYDPAGQILISSTYLGGDKDDWGYGV
ncbi:MAG: hypothetical protein V3T31_00960, partial [candidate division Zixibacteria bacterium]